MAEMIASSGELSRVSPDLPDIDLGAEYDKAHFWHTAKQSAPEGHEYPSQLACDTGTLYELLQYCPDDFPDYDALRDFVLTECGLAPGEFEAAFGHIGVVVAELRRDRQATALGSVTAEELTTEHSDRVYEQPDPNPGPWRSDTLEHQKTRDPLGLDIQSIMPITTNGPKMRRREDPPKNPTSVLNGVRSDLVIVDNSGTKTTRSTPETATKDIGVQPVDSRKIPVPVDDLEQGSRDEWAALLDGQGEESSWQERALCAQTDPEAFFPKKGGSTREAKKVCMSCEVREECLGYALTHNEIFGIWGGMSERERRKLKRRTS